MIIKKLLNIRTSHSCLLFVLFCLLIAGCNDSASQATLEAIKQQLASTSQSISPIANDVASTATQHASKIIQYEYKVILLDRDLDETKLESTLNLMGQARWECDSIMETDRGLRIICRRLPYGMLNYMLKFF